MKLSRLPRLRPVLAALLLLTCWQVQARDHVLILTISNYPQQPLKGVKHDAGNALRLARSLGYDTSQAQVLKDEQLNTTGLRMALQQLSPQVQLNDRVFIYYSGHGASMRQGTQCVQSLVAQDGGMIGVGELQAQLDAVKQRSRDVFVLIDACHSGGLADIAVMRSLPAPAAGNSGDVSAKVFNARDGEACHAPMNFNGMPPAPAPAAGIQRALFPQQNFSYIAAANEREVALDDSERGGLATVQLLQCAEQGSKDSDQSGQVSLKELLACAQEGIAEAVPRLNTRKGTRWTAHTLEAYGNTSRPLAAIKALPSATPPAGELNPQAEATLALFREIEAGANGNWQASFELPGQVRMGSKASLRYQSTQPGYLSIIYLGSDRRDIQLLARNVLVGASPGRELGQIPIKDCPGGCPGDNHFLLLLSQARLNTEGLLERAREGRMSNDVEGRHGLRCLLNPGDSNCPSRMRNAGALELAPEAAIAGYAAQVLVVRGD